MHDEDDDAIVITTDFDQVIMHTGTNIFSSF